MVATSTNKLLVHLYTGNYNSSIHKHKLIYLGNLHKLLLIFMQPSEILVYPIVLYVTITKLPCSTNQSNVEDDTLFHRVVESPVLRDRETT